MNGVPEAQVSEGDVLARETYRHLRLMLIMLPALMLVTILILYFRDGSVEESISAYYLGSVRDVFVGALVGTAVCLIVYRGYPPFEDYALNVAGFYGMFVAFVPTQLAESLADLSAEERQETLFGLRAALVAVVVIGIVFVAIERAVGHWTLSTLLARPATKAVFIGSNCLGVAFLALVWFRGFQDETFKGVHMSAAVLLFVSLALAVLSHAWPGPFGGEGPGRPSYWFIVVGMALGIPIAVVCEILGSEHTVIVIEAWEIAWFMGFWILEAKRTWPAPQ